MLLESCRSSLPFTCRDCLVGLQVPTSKAALARILHTPDDFSFAGIEEAHDGRPPDTAGGLRPQRYGRLRKLEDAGVKDRMDWGRGGSTGHFLGHWSIPGHLRQPSGGCLPVLGNVGRSDVADLVLSLRHYPPPRRMGELAKNEALARQEGPPGSDSSPTQKKIERRLGPALNSDALKAADSADSDVFNLQLEKGRERAGIDLSILEVMARGGVRISRRVPAGMASLDRHYPRFLPPPTMPKIENREHRDRPADMWPGSGAHADVLYIDDAHQKSAPEGVGRTSRTDRDPTGRFTPDLVAANMRHSTASLMPHSPRDTFTSRSPSPEDTRSSSRRPSVALPPGPGRSSVALPPDRRSSLALPQDRRFSVVVPQEGRSSVAVPQDRRPSLTLPQPSPPDNPSARVPPEGSPNDACDVLAGSELVRSDSEERGKEQKEALSEATALPLLNHGFEAQLAKTKKARKPVLAGSGMPPPRGVDAKEERMEFDTNPSINTTRLDKGERKPVWRPGGMTKEAWNLFMLNREKARAYGSNMHSKNRAAAKQRARLREGSSSDESISSSDSSRAFDSLLPGDNLSLGKQARIETLGLELSQPRHAVTIPDDSVTVGVLDPIEPQSSMESSPTVLDPEVAKAPLDSSETQELTLTVEDQIRAEEELVARVAMALFGESQPSGMVDSIGASTASPAAGAAGPAGASTSVAATSSGRQSEHAGGVDAPSTKAQKPAEPEEKRVAPPLYKPAVDKEAMSVIVSHISLTEPSVEPSFVEQRIRSNFLKGSANNVHSVDFITLDARDGEIRANVNDWATRDVDTIPQHVIHRISEEETALMAWHLYQYLREEKWPTIPPDAAFRMMEVMESEYSDEERRMFALKRVVATLSKENYVMAKAICLHMRRIVCLLRVDIVAGFSSLFGSVVFRTACRKRGPTVNLRSFSVRRFSGQPVEEGRRYSRASALVQGATQQQLAALAARVANDAAAADIREEDEEDEDDSDITDTNSVAWSNDGGRASMASIAPSTVPSLLHRKSAPTFAVPGFRTDFPVLASVPVIEPPVTAPKPDYPDHDMFGWSRMTKEKFAAEMFVEDACPLSPFCAALEILLRDFETVFSWNASREIEYWIQREIYGMLD
ncbi:hypothetical protein BDK51DRAFT_34366 [Blyttiomyces helicus]|uniref:Uncharacterized protein n=1 Tax=Blyttiomyces helicus TaxID=388810 RepID=A0A4P9WPC5_9FUNG|nr:hypothetical protein BDK51DRAFT_34366 [Blyttiomyces helicus]|eukprot:RKO93588.1 hypothetical protein BDK51DRAFT_34366 [Blyttiomyces helicus]